MKKHRNPFYSFFLVLSLTVLSFVSMAPASAATGASVTLHADPAALNSGYFQITLDANQGARFKVYVNDIPGRGYTEAPSETPINKQAELGFSNLAPGDTVYGCLEAEFEPLPVCSAVYQVPTGHQPVDSDNDGVNDDIDQCENTPAGTAVDGNGCTLVVAPPDSDSDGVPDDGTDECLGTLPGTVVDATGCAVVVPPADTDGDGVVDDVDNCRDIAGPASNGGCPLPVDSDNDGVNDDIDQCENTPAGTAVDAVGCAVVIPPSSPTIVEVKVKQDSLSQGCPAGKEIIGAHFVITQSVNDKGDNVSPSTISVRLSDSSTVSVSRTATTGDVAHYGLSLASGTTVKGATALLPDTWTGQFNLSHYNCGEPVPPVDVCPEDGHQSEGVECEPVVTPVTCSEGEVWKDHNDNGKVDDGECKKPAPPVVVPPVVVPPVVVAPPAVVAPTVSTPINSEVDETNGRGATVETAATEPVESTTHSLAYNSTVGSLTVLLSLAGWMLMRRRKGIVTGK